MDEELGARITASEFDEHMGAAQEYLRSARRALHLARLASKERSALELRMKGLCRLLQDEGHMTPMATHQILGAIKEHQA